MTSCFFSDVSIPTFTNICEADKIKFEYIFIMNYYLQGIYMYELVSSGIRWFEVWSSYLLKTNLLQKKNTSKDDSTSS